VDRHRVGHERPQIQDDLLKRVQLVDVDGVEPGLGGGAAGKEESIDIGKIAFARAEDKDGSKNDETDDIEV
jgi:hypothetical protein